MSEKFFTPDEVAELLKVTARTIRNLISEGELGAVKLGKQYRISENDLEDFLKKNNSRGE